MLLSILGFLLSFLSIFVFSFVLWRKLREDYTNDKIFLLTAGLVSATFISEAFKAGGFIGNWATGSLPLFSFWASPFLGVLVGAYLVKKLDLRFFDVVDGVAPAWFWLLLLGNLGAGITLRDLRAFIEPGLSAIALLGYTFFQARYRTFSWYPSGRVGFPGLASLGLYFLGRAAFGVYVGLTSSLSVGVFSAIMGTVLFLGCSVVIIFRSKGG